MEVLCATLLVPSCADTLRLAKVGTETVTWDDTEVEDAGVLERTMQTTLSDNPRKRKMEKILAWPLTRQRV